MTTLKLFGFTAEERQLLRENVQTERCEAGQLEELHAPLPADADQVWVVCVTAAEAFLQAVFDSPPVFCVPKAVLWVPQGHESLPMDDWWESFHAQLQEEHADDCTMLQRISRCARVLEWGERVEDIPAAWFAALTDTLYPYGIDELPFDAEAREHLKACVDCREEVYEWLQHRAGMRWALLCPTVDELAEWLETVEGETRLEAHVRGCGLCREIVKRQASLWEEVGLLTTAHMEAKFAAVGIAKPAVPSGMTALVTARLVWAQVQAPTAVAGAVLLAAAVRLTHAMTQPSWGTARGPAENMGVALEDQLMEGDQLSSEFPWLFVRVEDDTVLLWAGRSPTDRFEQFRMEFRRGEQVVVEVAAENGVARLSANVFQRAQAEGADQVVILG